MPYIGRPLNAGNLAVQSGTGDGSDTTPIATLDYSVGSSNSIGVYLDGVRQLAGTDFTASGTTLTFTTAPANGVGIDVYFLGLELSIPTPADGTVTTAKIAANAVDETKLKDALVADFTEVTVAAGDSILLGDATDSGNTKRDTVQGILDLVPAGGSLTLIGTTVASNDATITVTGLNSTYETYLITGSGIQSIADGQLYLRLGDSSGIDSGASDYKYHMLTGTSTSTAYNGNTGSSLSYIFCGSIGKDSIEGLGLHLMLSSPANGITAPSISGTYGGHAAASGFQGGQIAGARTAYIATTQVQLYINTGNVSTGRLTVWGISHA